MTEIINDMPSIDTDKYSISCSEQYTLRKDSLADFTDTISIGFNYDSEVFSLAEARQFVKDMNTVLNKLESHIKERNCRLPQITDKLIGVEREQAERRAMADAQFRLMMNPDRQLCCECSYYTSISESHGTCNIKKCTVAMDDSCDTYSENQQW